VRYSLSLPGAMESPWTIFEEIPQLSFAKRQEKRKTYKIGDIGVEFGLNIWISVIL
jgi:hypothetical protein